MILRLLNTIGSDQTNKLLLVSPIAIAWGNRLFLASLSLGFTFLLITVGPAWDCSGGPMVKTPHCLRRGCGLDPWSGNQYPSCLSARLKKKKIEPIWLLIHYYLKAFLLHSTGVCGASLNYCVAQSVKNLPIMQETQVWSLGWEDPLEKEWQPTPVFLPGESHRQRSLAGYSPRVARVGHNLATTPPPPRVIVGFVDVNGNPWKFMTSAMLVAFLSFIFSNYSVIFNY